MYRKDLEYYNHLVGILRQAYMDDTLEAKCPCNCGVGNILFAEYRSSGRTFDQARDNATEWINAFCTIPRRESVRIPPVILRHNREFMQVAEDKNSIHYIESELVLQAIKLPIEVLAELEWEFETNQIGGTKDERMFNGLMAAIGVLDKWFEVPPITQLETKKTFKKVIA